MKFLGLSKFKKMFVSFQIRRKPILLCIFIEEEKRSAPRKVRCTWVDNGKSLLPFDLEQANLV